jgi:oligoendopeptidase F
MSNSASGVAWDLRDLYAGLDDPKIQRDLDAARTGAEAFEKTYRGRIAILTAESAEFLQQAIRELELLYERMDKPAVYASLVHAARTDVPAHGALLAKTREERTAINKHLSQQTLVQDTFHSEPAPGRQKNDLKLVAALKYKF